MAMVYRTTLFVYTWFFSTFYVTKLQFVYDTFKIDSPDVDFQTNFRRYYDDLGYFITPQPYSAVKAAENLDNLESKILNDNVEHFLSTKDEKKNNLRLAIYQNKKDITNIKQALRKAERRGGLTEQLKKWLKSKENDEKLLSEEIELIDSITMLLTGLEAAKYLALAKQSTSDFDIDSINQKDNLEISGTKKGVIQPLLPHEEKTSQSDTTEETQFIDLENNLKMDNINEIEDNSDILTKSNQVKNKLDKDKALSAVSYIEKVTGFDTEGVSKLVSQLKELLLKEIAKKEELLANSQKLDEIERSITKRTLTQQNLLYGTEKNKANIIREIEETKKRLWSVKEMEWIITRIEAAKYLTMDINKSKNHKVLSV